MLLYLFKMIFFSVSGPVWPPVRSLEERKAEVNSGVWGGSERSTRTHLGVIPLSLTHWLFIKLRPTNISHFLLLQTPWRKRLSADLPAWMMISKSVSSCSAKKQWGAYRGGSGACWDTAERFSLWRSECPRGWRKIKTIFWKELNSYLLDNI